LQSLVFILQQSFLIFSISDRSKFQQIGRIFIRVGDLIHLTNQGVQAQDRKSYTFFLFSDILLWAEKQGKQLKFKSFLDLKKAQVITRSQRFSVHVQHLFGNKPPKQKQPGNSGSTFKKKASTATDIKNAIHIIVGDNLMSIVANTFEEREGWLKDLIDIADNFYMKRIFGIPLIELVERKNQIIDGVPAIIKKIAESFDENALKTEGIFRISVSQLQLDSYRQTIDAGNEIDFSATNPHVVANLVKLYLRALPEPLFTFQQYDTFSEIVSLPEESAKIEAAKKGNSSITFNKSAAAKISDKFFCQSEQLFCL